MAQPDIILNAQEASGCEEDFAEITGRLIGLIEPAQPEEIARVVAAYAEGGPPAGYLALVRGVAHYARQEYGECVEAMMRGRELLGPAAYPAAEGLYSKVWISAQLMLPRRKRPAAERAYANYKANIAALREVDAELAQEVQRSRWPEDLLLVDFWQGLHLFSLKEKKVFALEGSTAAELDKLVRERAPIGFGGASSGRELLYCLERQFEGLYGMARAHYLVETAAGRLRALLHLFDMSQHIESCEVIIFGGGNMLKRYEEVFSSLRYPNPGILVANDENDRHYHVLFQRGVALGDYEAEARDYYRSEDFRCRQLAIAEGAMRPRVMVCTCKWTSFLKYCAADFEKAFGRLGCETRFLIEENDVQLMLPAFFWRELAGFKPDMFFMVSHARATLSYLPAELPFVGYIQDKCGPLFQLADMRGHFSNQDLFVCMMREHQDFLVRKHVPIEQTEVLPIPTDEEVFYPVEDAGLRERFAGDIAYVKHGNADTDALMAKWLGGYGLDRPVGGAQVVTAFFREWYERFLREPEQRWYEGDIQADASERLKTAIAPEGHHGIEQLVTQFMTEIYPACWRRHYLGMLADADLGLKIYGKGWESDPRFQQYAAGAVSRGEELNAVYNYSRINLHIHPYATMHQRLVECGLAGGFIIVTDHPAAKDWEPARRYFMADEEVVFVEDGRDLVEKCRYYLEHEDRRREIAGNLRRRALAERTSVAAAETILAKWGGMLTASADLPGKV